MLVYSPRKCSENATFSVSKQNFNFANNCRSFEK